ncbi:MerR family transcriptional regulator [Inediibacterium massiliense]|uniref:MerR family transcriptional regulator n=1 Tax=Inediibacterium massiliense TaxID=1658111 RepID=UPI0006B41289|nr:MerR family transcriptional regulator [Inediibacterium massiliense]
MIDKEKRYSISEVSKLTGYEAHVLRYYESDFNLEIPRTPTNRRYYTYKEIERLFYIKELQERGLTNKQIKLILEAPELVIPSTSEVAATSESQELCVIDKDPAKDMIQRICDQVHETIRLNIGNKLEEAKDEIIDYFHSMKKEEEEIENTDVIRKEKDVLICENARLKMKVKEKSYEMAQLREKMKRLEEKNKPFWKKIFSKSS